MWTLAWNLFILKRSDAVEQAIFFSISPFSCWLRSLQTGRKKCLSLAPAINTGFILTFMNVPTQTKRSTLSLGRLTSHMSCLTADSSRPGCENIANTCLARFFDDDDFALTPSPRCQDQLWREYRNRFVIRLTFSSLLQSADTNPNPIVRNQVRSLRL